MGIDLRKQGRVRQRTFRASKSDNLYLGLLIKLYSFLARRTNSKFNQIVHKRLNQSNTTRYPMSISRLLKVANTDAKRARTLVLVGNVLNDERLVTVPKLNVCALKFTHAARERITKAGGRCMTFDELAKEAPTGAKTYAKGSHEKKHKIK